MARTGVGEDADGALTTDRRGLHAGAVAHQRHEGDDAALWEVDVLDRIRRFEENVSPQHRDRRELRLDQRQSFGR